ncbi:MAG: class I SAM-dependent methyltransferase [Anaerolineales bacterium]
MAHHLGSDGRVIGLDIHRQSLKRLKRNIEGTIWNSQIFPLQGDLRDPLPLERLDGYLLANVLHFFVDKEKKAILRRLLHEIRPGGQLILVEYNSHRGNAAVPHPLPAQDWLRLMKALDWQHARLQAVVPSSFLGEMAAIQAERAR